MNISVSKYELQVRLTEFLLLEKKQTADYAIATTLLENLDQFPNLYLDELAYASHASPAAVSKFLRKIGFESFASVKDTARTMNFSSAWPLFGTARSAQEMVLHFIDQKYAIEKAVARRLMDSALADFGRKIRQAGKVYVLGGIHSIASVNYFAELCAALSIRVFPVQRDCDAVLLESIAEKEMPVILISLTGRWLEKQTSRLSEAALQKLFAGMLFIGEKEPENADAFAMVLSLDSLCDSPAIRPFADSRFYLISNYLTDTALHLIFTCLAAQIRQDPADEAEDL